MENINNFGQSESGYGYNDDGTEKDKNDYYAENPQEQDDRYDEVYDQAQQEEIDEIRELYPDEYEPRNAHEALQDLHRLLDKFNERLDKIQEELDKNQAPTMESTEVRNYPNSTTASTVSSTEVRDNPPSGLGYIGANQGIYSTREDAINSFRDKEDPVDSSDEQDTKNSSERDLIDSSKKD